MPYFLLILFFLVGDSLRIVLNRYAYQIGADEYKLLFKFTFSAFIFITLFVQPFLYKEFKRLNLKLFSSIMGIHIWHYGIGTILTVLASKYTQAANVILIMSLTVITNAIVECTITEERFSKKFYLAFLLALAGVYLFCTAGGTISFQKGDILVFIAIWMWAFSNVFSRIILKKDTISPYLFASFRPYGYFVVLALACCFISPDRLIELPTPWNNAVDFWIALASFCMVFTWLILHKLYLMMPTTYMSTLGMLKTPIVALLGYYFLNETYGQIQIFGACLILTGVALATKEKKRSA